MGIIGVGHWGPNLVRNFHEHPDADVHTICDANDERLAPFAQTHPRAKLEADWRRVIADTDIDAVAIATPTYTHYRITRQALESGKHVFVEKPLATSVREAEELVQMAAARNLRLMVGHVFLFNPAVRFMRETIERGELGRLLYFNFTRTNLGPVRDDVNVLWDLAPHDVSMLLYLLGESPDTVSARGASYLNPPLEDVVFASLRFPRGVLANLHVSWLDSKRVRRVTMVGSEKMIVFDDLDKHAPIRIFQNSREGECVVPEIGGGEPLRLECAAFIDWINGGKSQPSDAAFGTEVVRVLQSISESIHHDGRPIISEPSLSSTPSAATT